MAGLSAIIKELAAGAAADKKSMHKILIIAGSICLSLCHYCLLFWKQRLL